VVWFLSIKSSAQSPCYNQFISSWKELSGAMPQGSWLGPLSFLVLINDLSTDCPVHKHVDDATISEVLPPKQLTSNVETTFTTWSTGQL